MIGLFIFEGKRKYLTAEEQGRLIAAPKAQVRAEVRTMRLTWACACCRISEALALTAVRVDLSKKSITYQTLRQRGRVKYRSVPRPDVLMDVLELVHRVRKANKTKHQAKLPLWLCRHTQATRYIWSVMDDAGITGDHASPKGLRHGFGARTALQTSNPRLVRNCWGTPIRKPLVFI